MGSKMNAGKNNFGEVAVYAAILAVLLGWRVWQALRKRAAKAAAGIAAARQGAATQR